MLLYIIPGRGESGWMCIFFSFACKHTRKHTRKHTHTYTHTLLVCTAAWSEASLTVKLLRLDQPAGLEESTGENEEDSAASPSLNESFKPKGTCSVY